MATLGTPDEASRAGRATSEARTEPMELMMSDLGAIPMALTSLKTSADIAKAMLGLRDANLVREKAVELTAEIVSAQQSTLAAQAAQSALLEEIGNLKKKIVEFEDWDREKAKYQLVEIATGVFVYETKQGMEAGEPTHRLCAQCYQQRRKSILQSMSRSGGAGSTGYLVCTACKAELPFKFTPHSYSGRTRNPGYLNR